MVPRVQHFSAFHLHCIVLPIINCNGGRGSILNIRMVNFLKNSLNKPPVHVQNSVVTCMNALQILRLTTIMQPTVLIVFVVTLCSSVILVQTVSPH